MTPAGELRKQWKDLVAVVDRFAGQRVLVAGDLVLDRFWYGSVQRVSREAPVPIVRLFQTRLLPGCAANTVWNLAALGAVPVPVGVVGTDREGEELLKFLEGAGAELSCVERSKDWVTPTKTRVLAGTFHGPKQQMVRVDSGEENHLSPGTLRRLRTSLEGAAETAAALIISDYGYGLAQAVGAAAFTRKVRLSALDSRFAMEDFAGAGLTTATPNEEEFERACGAPASDDAPTLEAQGEKLRARLGLKALLVTRGSKGMSLFEAKKPPLHIPVVGSDQVVDVTGAGDTVISTYVLSLSCGTTFAQAAAIANAAGGIVVQKHGTATASPDELRHALTEWGEGRL